MNKKKIILMIQIKMLYKHHGIKMIFKWIIKLIKYNNNINNYKNFQDIKFLKIKDNKI